MARHLIDAGVSKIVIANRTLGRARELAQKFSAEAVLLSEIPEQLIHADIVVTSTASQLPILGKGAVESALKLRKHRPMLMVDIAVPRDIEAQVGELRDVYLYSVDDLRDIVDQNLRGRQTEARKADVIIAEGVLSHREAERSLAAVDTVKVSNGGRQAARRRVTARFTVVVPRREPGTGTCPIGQRSNPEINPCTQRRTEKNQCSGAR